MLREESADIRLRGWNWGEALDRGSLSWVLFPESLFKQRIAKGGLWVLGHWLEGKRHPASGDALLVGTGGGGVTSV